ncbi:hypothetical protein NPIL_26031 [Nephila pilipes]|uniref:Uncharacterized protein n=1 Tax=Nephila pilipes TaxID=299642 RepID=A0A8X6TW82_NEPPI|nr:hypothetical protein NPIL_26031 [Nephila pilipes]
MAFLIQGKKEDLRRLAWEMGLVVAEDLHILDIKQLILNSEKYEENSIKNLLMNIIEERLEKNKEAEQLAEQERRKAEMDFELQKLKLQLEAKKKKWSDASRGDKLKTDDRSERPSVSCYGCGKPGVTNPRCSNCKSTANMDSGNLRNIILHSCSSTPNQSAELKLAANGTWGTACADTGASHTIAGETLYSGTLRYEFNSFCDHRRMAKKSYLKAIFPI